jgi:hypothetical protein
VRHNDYDGAFRVVPKKEEENMMRADLPDIVLEALKALGNQGIWPFVFG